MTDTGPPEHLVTASGRRVAYRLSEGSAPGVVFCPGLKSDMEGTKALALEQWCRARGQACLRFDYSGHGSSDGRFEDGTIGAWKDDALAVLDACSEGPQVVVGSSMGGWIALLIARERPERVAGLVLVAPAPDFTRRMWDEELDAAARASLHERGYVELPSEYGDEPYRISRALIEDGARQQVLGGPPVRLGCGVRILHGMRDSAVPWRQSLDLAAQLDSPDVVLTFSKQGDHRLSTPADIERLCRAVGDLSPARDQ